MSPQNGPKEAALVTQNAAGLFRVLESGQAVGVLQGAGAVVLVQRQAGKAEQGQRHIVGAFRWQKIAMVLPAKLFHQGHPELAVVLKLLELVGVDDVAQVAGDHGVSQG